MIRFGSGGGAGYYHNPTQKAQLWQERCEKEEGKQPRNRKHTQMKKLTTINNNNRQDDDKYVLLNSSRSRTSLMSARSTKSNWSLSSFETQDSGFTYYANKRFAEFEKALEEEKKKRQEAEDKLKQLTTLLEHRHETLFK